MRIHEGDYAYDIEPVRDPLTQLQSGWKYRIFQLRPEPEQVLLKGHAESRAAAEKKAKAALSRIMLSSEEIAA